MAARLIQAPVGRSLGQTIVIENRPGGAGVAPTEAIISSRPDGYTFGLVNTSHTSNPAMFPSLPYDSVRDIMPVAFFWRATLAISAHRSLGVSTLAELVAKARAQPGVITYATGGIGMATHFAGEMLQQRTGTQMQHAPYRGGGPALADATAGHVPLLISGVGLVAPFVADGTMRVLAVTSAERSGNHPDIPTVAEAGYPGFERSEWYGFIAPVGVPARIVERTNASIVEVLRQPEVVAKFRELDLTTEAMTPEAFGRYLREETERMTALVRIANIKPQ